MNDGGRPEYTDEQYRVWLNEMAPFLKIGYSLYSSIDKALLLRHKDSIYRKVRLNDWFCEKIEAFQRYPGEIVNSIFSRLILMIDDKVKRGQPISSDEWRNLRFFAERHRSCQPFFVTRTEKLQIEPDAVGKIIDNFDNKVSDYTEIALMASKQIEKLNTNLNI